MVLKKLLVRANWKVEEAGMANGFGDVYRYVGIGLEPVKRTARSCQPAKKLSQSTSVR